MAEKSGLSTRLAAHWSLMTLMCRGLITAAGRVRRWQDRRSGAAALREMEPARLLDLGITADEIDAAVRGELEARRRGLR